MQKIVITGVSGFVGSHLFRLLRETYQVYGVTRGVENGHQSASAMICWDITKPAPTEFALKDAIVIHAAALMPRGNSSQAVIEANVTGTKNCLDWAVANNAKQFINLSSGSVYGFKDGYYHKESDRLSPIGSYGHSKYIAENLLTLYSQEFNLPAISLRLFYPYGPQQQKGIIPLLEKMINEAKPISLDENLRPHLNPIHIDDIMTAFTATLGDFREGHRIYNLCGDETLSFAELIKILENKLDAKACFSPEKAAPQHDLLGDNTLLKQHYNWHPKKSLIIAKHNTETTTEE